MTKLFLKDEKITILTKKYAIIFGHSKFPDQIRGRSQIFGRYTGLITKFDLSN